MCFLATEIAELAAELHQLGLLCIEVTIHVPKLEFSSIIQQKYN
jgi:hypothetical protein